MERLDRFWVGVAAAAFMACLAGIFAFLALRPDPGPPLLVVSRPSTPAWTGDIYVGGAVANPGLYPYSNEDSVGDLVAAAGERTDSADPSRLSLIIPATQESHTQRIDINRADAWLLEALPGVGPATAGSIVEYREANGPFRMVRDLLKVPGIGESTLARIAGYVTAGE